MHQRLMGSFTGSASLSSMDCVFCKIVDGKFDSAKIYEDNDVVAFLDIKPVTKGHTLVIPKRHAQDIFDIPETDLQKIIGVAKKISGKIKNDFKADGINFLQSNGAAAGQVVFHYHMHIIPRYKGDGIILSEGSTTPPADMAELEKLAEQLKI